MKRFLEVEPSLLVTTLDPQYGDRYLSWDRHSPSIHRAFDSADSYAKKFRFAIMAEARFDLIKTLNEYVRSGEASVEDILRLDDERHVHTMLLSSSERKMVAEEAADNVVLTCAESALQQDPVMIMDHLWPEAEVYAKRNDLERCQPGTIILRYIEHCMMYTRGSELVKAIAKL